MTFDEIWAQLCRKDPQLVDPAKRVELSAGNFKMLLRQVYEQAEK